MNVTVRITPRKNVEHDVCVLACPRSNELSRNSTATLVIRFRTELQLQKLDDLFAIPAECQSFGFAKCESVGFTQRLAFGISVKLSLCFTE